MDTDIAHALVRFGLGRRGYEPLPTDPGAWRKGAVVRAGSRAAAQSTQHRGRTGGSARGPAEPPAARPVARAATVPPGRHRAAGQCTGHRSAVPRTAGLVLDQPLHVSLRRGECAALAGAFVEEAIRPHVTGRFADMLLAAMRHPAMLLYLDNVFSAGPDSPAGQRGKRGLNENLARECLELHTVSPAAGYTQTDVTEFRAGPDRLVHRPDRRSARLPLPSLRARARRAVRDGPPLSARRGRRRGRPALPRSASGDASLPGDEAGAAFRRRRSAGGCGPPHRGRAARQRRRSRSRRRRGHHAGGGMAAADQAAHAARLPGRHPARARSAGAAA